MPAPLHFLSPARWMRSVSGQPPRVFLALASLLALCSWNGWSVALIPLYLGVIASALAETDDSWRGRLRAQCVTLTFFAVAAWSVQALIDLPWWFILAVAASVFCLTLMGALQARYKSIGFATIVLALYTTIGIDGRLAGDVSRHREPLLLLAGAAWYGALAIASSVVWPAQPVQDRLVKLFSVLGTYMSYKASLFEPLRGVDIPRKRLSLARLNAGVVAELNEAKDSIVRRSRPATPTGRLARYRGLYLIAQDVHERASSSHGDYNALADAFFHSDLLYRCQRVLMLQGDACSQLADSIERRVPFALDTASVQALAELRSAIEHQRARPESPVQASLLASVDALADNLAQLDAQLAGASEPAAQMGRTDQMLSDTSPRTLRDMVARVRRQLSPGSELLRHALRLALALAAGYAVTRWLHPAQGYWIMLTTLFVCRQSYGDTVTRLGQRTVGTVVGVLAGWALLQLFPQAAVQSLLAVAAGVIFSANRVSHYPTATAAMTVLVLLCSNQVGQGAVLIVPRLVDTGIGCLIAWAAVLLIFPHWQSRRFSELAAAALRGHADYLLQVTRQYGDGTQDDQPYRAGRRKAHDADAALSNAVVDMYREPGRMRPNAGIALRFLIQSHTLLNYISALGAHRAALPDPTSKAAFAAQSDACATALQDLAMRLFRGSVATVSQASPSSGAADPANPSPAPAASRQDGDIPGGDSSARLISTELSLIRIQIDTLDSLATAWIKQEALDEHAAPGAG